MKKKNIKVISLSAGIIGIASALGYAYHKLMPKVKLKEYTKACLYIAVMDDEISRNELEGNSIGGTEIVFPERRETLKGRYKMHLNMHKKCSKEKLEKIIKEYEERLKESRIYKDMEKQDLSLYVELK